MRNVIAYRREIGPAAWLLLLYWQHCAPSGDPAWCLVANGEPIQDGAIARRFAISIRTAKQWRRRLQDAGLTCTEACTGNGFRVWLLRFDQPEVDAARTAAPADTWPDMPTQVIQ